MKIFTRKIMIDFRKNHRRRGVALIELALVLSILLVLSMMLVQFGIIMNAAVGITNLSREGARFAAVQPGVDKDIKDRMKEVCPPSIRWADVENNIVITPAQGSSDRVVGSRQLIYVQINYDMSKKLFLPSQLKFPLMRPIKIFNGTYTAKAVMMVE